MEVSASGDNNITPTERLAMIEEQELDAPQGQLPGEVYCELLALYIYHEDLNNSKLLWKRIPTQCKTELAELKALWEVCKAFWQKDSASVFQQCSAYTWSEIIQKIIDDIMKKHKEKCICLISQSYSSIGTETSSALLGCTTQEALELAVSMGWTVSGDQKFIMPLLAKRQEGSPVNNEAYLQKLTQYISFLET
uniref:COP9 signalosome complex subunit 8-like n=1 Tax=Styela clava TaxID=7725 RepID=UPI00193A9EF6|nr:COP9 signalosome complex subunit 8-like [Styela clava]XP_039254881.1 COP9 signalosome complex subunit 8-like [Styela clava]